MPSKQQSERPFLGEALNRLNRMLGVQGSVSPNFRDGSDLIPTVLLGDGTLPGYGQQSLRRFLASEQGAQAAGQPTTVGFQAAIDVIITRFSYSFTAAAGLQRIKYFGPNDNLPYALSSPNGVWVDRAITSAETSPLTSGTDITGIAIAGGTVYRYESQAAQVGLLIEALRGPFLLAQGAALFLMNPTVNVRWNVNVEGMAL